MTISQHVLMAQALEWALGMSREVIADATGVAFSSIDGWIRGKRKPNAASAAAIERTYREALRVAFRNERVRAVTAQLHVQYGPARRGSSVDALDELFSSLCALKTSHQEHERAYEALANAFRPWRKLAAATQEDVEESMRRAGFGSIKAKAFIDIAQTLRRDFGRVTLAPLKKLSTRQALEYLESLPGVGVMTARSVALQSLGADCMSVDAHTYRVAVRLGLIPTCKNPEQAHRELDAVVPPRLSHMLHTGLVAHGHAVCRDLRPNCAKCTLNNHCETGRAALGASHSSLAPAIHVPAVHSASTPVAVDIYAGCGGLSLGLKQAGFRIGYALDWDQNACRTHAKNFPDVAVQCTDVRRVSVQAIRATAGGRVDLIAGGPNCQGVSQRGLRSPDDPRNFMFPEFLRLVEGLRPHMVLMENVPGLAHRHNFQLLKSIFAAFEHLGYTCGADVVLAADYGVPQLRYRFLLIGTLSREKISLPFPTHTSGSTSLFGAPYISLREAIADLPKVSAGYSDRTPLPYSSPPTCDYQKRMRGDSAVVFDHVTSATEEINLARASFIPPGGNWKDIPPSLLPRRFYECRLTDHSTTYARPRWDMPAFTITALMGNITAGAFTHPEQNRAFSVREGARIQSFPDCFKFEGPINSMYRQVGNAVPPSLARAVGTHLLSTFRGERVAGLPPRITREQLNDPRGWDALPVLTPRFKPLFGSGTRWPKGWGESPADASSLLDGNFRLRADALQARLREATLLRAETEADC